MAIDARTKEDIKKRVISVCDNLTSKLDDETAVETILEALEEALDYFELEKLADDLEDDFDEGF